MSSTPSSNIETMQTIYDAFARADVPAILDKLADGVTWDTNVDSTLPQAGKVPWWALIEGRPDVPDFFSAFGQNIEVHSFTSCAFLSGDNEVGTCLQVECTLQRTGKRIALRAIHHWVVDGQGRVVSCLDFADTLAIALASEAPAGGATR